MQPVESLEREFRSQDHQQISRDSSGMYGRTVQPGESLEREFRSMDQCSMHEQISRGLPRDVQDNPVQPGKPFEREFITQQIGADSISKSHEIHAGYMQPLACSQLNLLKGYFSRKRYQIL